jgi:hypothetical protein
MVILILSRALSVSIFWRQKSLLIKDAQLVFDKNKDR